MPSRRWTLVAASLLALVLGGLAADPSPVWAATNPTAMVELCVGGPGCFATIQAAVDAAHDGDTIHVGPGTFAGGITIDKSVNLVGVAAAAARIEGGGPVITIGDALTPDPLTVSISGVTITGGFNDSQPESPIGPGFFAAGGGLLITQGAGFTTGATVTVTDSVITGNRVTAGPPVVICEGGGTPCSFASGGGIANWGTLTLTNTRVANNVAGATATSDGLATDARGGGIWNADQGTLTMRHSFVTGNRTAVSAPNGRWAEGGGILDDGTLVIEDSVVSGNWADASSAMPSSFPFAIHQEAHGGGVRLSEMPGSNATITGTTISDNLVTATNSAGDASARSGGIDDEGTLVLVDSTVDRNTVQASLPPGSTNTAAALFGGISVLLTPNDGRQAQATIRTSSISHNVLTVLNPNGATGLAASGIGNASGRVTLDRTQVIGNRGTSDGASGQMAGGGIFNTQFAGGPPELAMSDSVVTANQLTAAPGVTIQGGGIYTADFVTGDPFPTTLTRTVVAGNQPDQCFGC